MRHPVDMLASIELDPPPVRYDGPRASRDSTELWSEAEVHLKPGALVLDLGCGPRDQAPCAAYLGYGYVGIDYSGNAADVLADAHALPFRDSSFDCVFSYAVLEHLHSPAVALSEICRVLKPGGLYVGTVSQGEPFHDSYFHMTAWGFCALVAGAPSLEVRRLWAGPDTLWSLATMGRYPKVIKLALATVQAIHSRVPWLAPRKARWPVRERRLDRLHRAGSICFSVVKER
jgi:SAM-dependent methyltransferase